MIDQTTVNQILDTADIVDVVSDFVSLRQRGANWVGLCPFHNDRTPSFYVSRAKGICKCFSCGEGGSAVNFIMKHEQMTYVEALKYLANKYHIEIKERELTDEERSAQTERESMLVLNEWACQFFEDQLWNTTQGQEIGLSYFRQRGFSDATIRLFRLGYSPDNSNTLYRTATQQGYSHDLLLKLGLCKMNQQGRPFDFYRGRVMFPIFNVAGKVIAFGGRTLKKDDKAKYFNSPESIIYTKSSSTMYGLYQAKRAIVSEKKCFIVEGYADVISMHQAGFQNVIASSGTALTEGHIHLLHRFTDTVTEMFDGDEAGIHAALRGIDMLLREGLNIKVLLLPDGEDPDSFAQSHSSSEVQQYIEQNEQDFIRFKSEILLRGAGNDPIRRAQAIEDVVKSIAVIPQEITRSVYAKECAALFGIQESVLLRDIYRHVRKNLDEQHRRRQQSGQQPTETPVADQPQDQQPLQSQQPVTQLHTVKQDATHHVAMQEHDLVRYIAKYAMCYLCDTIADDGSQLPSTVIEYIRTELDIDNIQFTVPAYKKIYDIALSLIDTFRNDLAQYDQETQQWMQQAYRERLKTIDPTGLTSNELQKKEEEITAALTQQAHERLDLYRQCYLEKILCSHLDDEVRNTACDLVSDKYQLSKIHTQLAHITTERERLISLVPKAICTWKDSLLKQQIYQLCITIAQTTDQQQCDQFMQQLQQLYQIRSQLSKLIGDRVVVPK